MSPMGRSEHNARRIGTRGGGRQLGQRLGTEEYATWHPDNCPMSTLVFPRPIDVTWRGWRLPILPIVTTLFREVV